MALGTRFLFQQKLGLVAGAAAFLLVACHFFYGWDLRWLVLALVPLLILNFGFGFTPRIIAVALASGPMVMINAATGFRRVDTMKIALARSCGASTLQIFTKIRIPMAMPMVIVGLMIGAIFGMITAVGAEMSGGGFGLGSRLTTYSSTLRMPEFFACIVILAVTGITIYAFFFRLGKRLAGWES